MNQLCLNCGWTGSVRELLSILPHEPGEVCPECGSLDILEADSPMTKTTIESYLRSEDPQRAD